MPRAVHSAPSRRAHWVVRAVELAILAGIGVVVALVALHRSSSPAVAARLEDSQRAHVKARAKRADLGTLKVVSVLPQVGATGVSPTATVTVRFSAPLAKEGPLPSLSPAESGAWQRVGPFELVFHPTSPVVPLTVETLRIPGRPRGVRGSKGAYLPAPVVDHWEVRNGSILRLQQVLATLGYLPLTWTASTVNPSGSAADLAALYRPPTGQFAWRYANTPPSLQAAFAPGVDNHMTTGAMVSFEVHDGLPGYTSIRPLLWPTLLSAEAADRMNPIGYTYALVSQQIPESITLWHDGADVFTSPVNTGIAATPTPTGTYFVYRRFASTTMSGTNPNGTYYLDHGVRWVNYFDGGVAIHGFVRAAYGFPQSLGCVELPVANAAVAWHWIHYGTVVTVLPAPAGSAST